MECKKPNGQHIQYFVVGLEMYLIVIILSKTLCFCNLIMKDDWLIVD